MFINFKKILGYFNSLIKSLQTTDTWQQIKPCDVLLVRADANCGYRYEGKAYAQIIDSFGELCVCNGLSVRSVAKGNSRLIGDKAYFSPVCINRASLRIIIISKLIQMIRGYKIGNEWKESHRVDLWYQIIKKAKPKCIIGIQPDEYLCQAANLQKIPVYDLQHGLNTNDNPFYGEKFRAGTPTGKLPYGFLCWDDQGVKPIIKWALKNGIRILKVGNPWFLRFSRHNPGDELVNAALAEENIVGDDRPFILVSLQWKMAEIAPDQVSNNVMPDALEKVILDTGTLYNWICRIHPIQLNGVEGEKTIEYLKKTFGIEKTRLWLMTSWLPIPQVLKKADLHITFSSAVVVEAAWMGVRSGILNKQVGQDGISKDWFAYERSLGMAEIIPLNPEIIKQWIVDTLAKGRGQSTLNDSGQGLDAFIDEISGIKS